MQDESHGARFDELGKTLFYQAYQATERQRSYFPRTHCAYIDDSGSHAQGEVFVMAGLVAGWSEWAKFSEEWRGVLEEKPRLGYFKLKEALRLEEQFGRLNPKQRDDRCDRFFSILKRTAMFSISASVPWDSRNPEGMGWPRCCDSMPSGLLTQRKSPGAGIRLSDACRAVR